MIGKKTPLFILMSLVLFSCNKLEDIRNNSVQERGNVMINHNIYSDIQLNHMDLTVRPQDDFFQYVNGKWVEKTKIPADKASWGAFNELRESTDEHSLALLKKLLLEPQITDSEVQKVKTTFQAYMDFDVRNHNGLTPLNDYFVKINKTTDIAELQKVLAEFGKKGLGNPFYYWYIEADMKQSQKNAVYETGGLILLPRDYYHKKSAKNDEVIAKYKGFIAHILSKIGYQDADELADKIILLEKKMAQYLLKNEEIRDAELQYNPQTLKELSHLSQNVRLADYLAEVGVKTNRVIIDEIKYFKHLDEIFNHDDIEILKAYYKYWLVVKNHDVLNKDIDDSYFKFFNYFLQGQQEQRKLDKKGLDFINQYLGEAFGKVYVQQYFSEQSKQQMIELINYLKKSYAFHIKQLTWMGDETKQKALYKLNKLTVKVGYPDQWKDFSELHIEANEKNIFSIKEAILKWKYQQDLKKVGQKVDKSEWSMSPQTVNAYYNPLRHEIVFPAAILQSPFFNPTADAAVNFGGIGGVIGHEMTHGFDDSGSKFDADGNLNNWWTRADKASFDSLTEKLAEQFSQYEVVEGHFINGKFTLGENIADLGGVNIAYDALQLYLKDKNIPQRTDDKNKNSFTQNQKFFISWANVWRTKSTRQYLENQVKVDPHSPGQLRAYVPLTNVDAFYDAFNIQPLDKLYKKPEDRIKIW